MGCDTDNYKRQEVKDLYNVIYNNRIRKGLSVQQAKRIAMDAASLRFGISNDRVRHILYDKEENKSYRSFIYQNNISIIASLREVILTYGATLETYQKMLPDVDEGVTKELISAKITQLECKLQTYEKLIKIIEEVNEYYSGSYRKV